MNAKNSFILYTDLYLPVRHLSFEQKGKLFDAFFLYNQGESVRFDEPLLEMAFAFFEQVFKRDREKYQNIVERNRENGKSGGRPKKLAPAGEEPALQGVIPANKQPVSSENPKPEKADSDNDSDNDNDFLNTYPDGYVPPNPPEADGDPRETHTGSQPGGERIPNCPFTELVDLYHTLLPSLPRVKAHTENRQAHARGRWRETWDKLRKEGRPHDKTALLAYFEHYFQYAAESDFLMGRKTNWSADFEWLFKSGNFAKTIEGRYENRAEAT